MKFQERLILETRITAKKQMAERVVVMLKPIKEELSRIEGKVSEYAKTYSYWLNYNHPTVGVSNANINDSYSQWGSMLLERKRLLATVGLRKNALLRIEIISNEVK